MVIKKICEHQLEIMAVVPISQLISRNLLHD